MSSDAQDTLPSVGADSDETSAPFIGKWNRLVSRTNWEKGRIICQWREALVAADRPAHECSDEAWATRVGGISAQHVGRLRRVWQRFGESCEEYDGLYWSHFLIAMDWEGAEMWLEGAARSGWSVSQMRAARWEALGATDELKPRDEDVLTSEWDEDSPLRPVGDGLRIVDPEARDPAGNRDADAGHSGSAARERVTSAAAGEAAESDLAEEPAGAGHEVPSADHVRPFASLPELPEDLAEAFEQFKIAILAHRASGWREISCEDVIAALEALKALALARLERNGNG